MLLENPSIENYVKISHELDNIISCSQLEEHTNNQIIAEKIKYIVDSLITVHTPSQHILDIINKSLGKLMEDTSNENYLLDLNLIEEIKTKYDALKKMKGTLYI